MPKIKIFEFFKCEVFGIFEIKICSNSPNKEFLKFSKLKIKKFQNCTIWENEKFPDLSKKIK